MGSSVTPALIICGAIGAAFLLLALVLVVASLSAREKKEKVVEVQQQGGFFASSDDRSKIRAASRTNARQAAQYADLADLPGEDSSRGVQQISRPLSHTELLGQLGDEEEDRT